MFDNPRSRQPGVATRYYAMRHQTPRIKITGLLSGESSNHFIMGSHPLSHINSKLTNRSTIRVSSSTSAYVIPRQCLKSTRLTSTVKITKVTFRVSSNYFITCSHPFSTSTPKTHNQTQNSRLILYNFYLDSF